MYKNTAVIVSFVMFHFKLPYRNRSLSTTAAENCLHGSNILYRVRFGSGFVKPKPNRISVFRARLTLLLTSQVFSVL